MAISASKAPTHTIVVSHVFPEKTLDFENGNPTHGKIICGFRIAISGLKAPTHTSRFSRLSGKDLGFQEWESYTQWENHLWISSRNLWFEGSYAHKLFLISGKALDFENGNPTQWENHLWISSRNLWFEGSYAHKLFLISGKALDFENGNPTQWENHLWISNRNLWFEGSYAHKSFLMYFWKRPWILRMGLNHLFSEN